MKDKIQFIRQKCVEANAEIVELKAGCEVISGKTQFTIQMIVDRVGIYQTSEGRVGEFTKATIFDTVIGRPIRLADVLLALKKADMYFAVDGRGDFMETDGTRIGQNGTTWGYYPSWNLRADDLEKQSEETINFIHSLLS